MNNGESASLHCITAEAHGETGELCVNHLRKGKGIRLMHIILIALFELCISWVSFGGEREYKDSVTPPPFLPYNHRSTPASNLSHLTRPNIHPLPSRHTIHLLIYPSLGRPSLYPIRPIRVSYALSPYIVYEHPRAGHLSPSEPAVRPKLPTRPSVKTIYATLKPFNPYENR